GGGGPGRSRPKAQRRGRRRQLDALELVAQELEEPQAVAGMLEELEPVNGWLGAPMLEDEHELPDLRVPDRQLASQLLRHAGDRIDENRKARALVRKLDLEIEMLRRLERNPRIGQLAERLGEGREIGVADSACKTVSRKPQALSDRRDADAFEQIERGVGPARDAERQRTEACGQRLAGRLLPSSARQPQRGERRRRDGRAKAGRERG